MEQKKYRKVVLGPRYAVQIQDLRPCHRLRVKCFACRHVGVIALSALESRAPPFARIQELERLFRCRQCHQRGGVVSWYVEEVETRPID